MKNIYFILASLLILGLTYCKKNTTPTVIGTSYINGTLRDETGFDGCSWLIELDAIDQFGNKMLEPINLESFNLNLVSGHRVKFNYMPKADRVSPCMRGTIVELTRIENK